VFSAAALREHPGGVRVSHPALRKLPTGVLQLSIQGDVRAIRQVSLPDDVTVWVEPYSAGICVYTISYGVCSGSVASARQSGISMNYLFGGDAGKRVVIGVVPDTNATVRGKLASGRIVTYPVWDGVYVVPTGLRHIYIRSL
jgi:hypothetical protein